MTPSSHSPLLRQSCPHCEFTRNSAGRTRMGSDGRMFCAECGSTWIDIDAAGGGQTEHDNPQRNFAFSHFLRWIRIRTGLAAVALPVVAIMLAALAFTMTNWLFSGQPTLDMAITDAIQVERDGRIAVKVQGTISNPSGKALPLDAVEIVLIHENSHRYYRWTYNPGIRELAPGHAIRFSTADGGIPRLASRVEIGHSGVIIARNL